MRFEDVTTCDYAATAVVDAMIWHLEDLAAFMDNVSEIKTSSFEEIDGPVRQIRTVRRWQGTASSVPALLRPFVTKNSLAWIDHGLWTPSEYKVEWRIESPHSRYSSCSGVNIFAPDPQAPDKTRCVIAGDFTVHGDKLPAMPAFLGLKMAPRLEQLILGFMMPNFRQLAVGLSGYLKAKASGPQAP